MSETKSMNLFQAANLAATFLILSALVAGLAVSLGKVNQDLPKYFHNHLEIVYLGLFMIVFRIKTTLDDHKHFGEPQQDKNIYRYAGFVSAVLAWVFWALAAYLLSTAIRASEFMALSILCFTGWIAFHLLEIWLDPNRRNTEIVTSLMREKWVLINVGYLLCLVGYIGWFRPLLMPGDRGPLLALLGLLAFDMLTSRSFRNVTS